MYRKKQTNTRFPKHRSDRMLHLKVSSPRIVFFQSKRAIWNFLKIATVLSIVAAGCIYGTRYVQNYFLTNPDFTLRHFELKTNGFLDETRVAKIACISPNETIFSFDIDSAEALLMQRPEIVDASVERRLPDTVKITLVERVPIAWIDCPKHKFIGRNASSGILLDENGIVFKCEGEKLWEVAKNLPVIALKDCESDDFLSGAKMQNKDVERALSLIELIADEVQDGWKIERITIENFYKLVMTSDDNVTATFGMYGHERQLRDLIAARRHAALDGRELEWINLLPKHNIPGNFKPAPQLPKNGVTNMNE